MNMRVLFYNAAPINRCEIMRAMLRAAIALSMMAGGGALSCAPWLEAYTRFHEAGRLDDTAQTFTIMKRGHQGIGYGDTFRVMLWGLRYAAATNRVLYISAEQTPIPFLDIMEPSTIDWRLPSASIAAEIAAETPIESRLLTLHDQAALRTRRHVVSDGINQADQEVWHDSPPVEFDVNVSLPSSDMHCLWRSLFRPSTKLEAALHEERSTRPRDFTSIHIRSGGLRGEMSRIDRGDPIHMVVGSLYCARAWGYPIYMAASDFTLRRAVNEGAFEGVTGPSEAWAIHAALDTSSTPEEHYRTLVEIGMLSAGRCIVVSSSGFSNVALWWGGQTSCARYVGIPPVRWGAQPPEPLPECHDQLVAAMTAECAASLGAAELQLASALRDGTATTRREAASRVDNIVTTCGGALSS